MEPPRRPNEAPLTDKESASEPVDEEDRSMVDDPTLMVVVSVLYAFIQYFAHFNAPKCTC